MGDTNSRRESAVSSHHSLSSAPSTQNTPARPRSYTDAPRQPSIRIRRFPSYNALAPQGGIARQDHATADESVENGRRRSHSDPQRTHLRPGHDGNDARRRGLTASIGHELLPEIVEGAPMNVDPPPVADEVPTERKKNLRKHRGRLFRRSSNGSVRAVPPQQAQEEYANGLVDVLDLVGMHTKIFGIIDCTNESQTLKYPR